VTVVAVPSWMLAFPTGRSIVKPTDGAMLKLDQWNVLGPQVPSNPHALLGLYERWPQVTTPWLNGRLTLSSIHLASPLGPCIRNLAWPVETSSSNVERVFALGPPATSSMQPPSPPPFET